MRKTNIKRTFVLTILASLLVSIVGCTGEQETVKTNSLAFVAATNLGVVRRTVYVRDTLGNLVPSNSSFNASAVRFTIDQRNRLIQNPDSLLYGSKLNRVLVTISYTGGYLSYREAGVDTAAWKPYSSTDSMDLSKPVQLCVIATDGVSMTYYTLKVNVHQQEGDSLVWTSQADTLDCFGAMTEMRAVELNSQVLVLGRTARGIELAAPHPTVGWARDITDLPTNTVVGSLQTIADSLFVSTADGVVYASTNGRQWTQMNTAIEGLQLVAASGHRLYALLGGRLCHASVTADDWTDERLGEEPQECLPKKAVASIAYEKTNTNRIVLLGENEQCSDSTYVVWSKYWINDLKQDQAEWIYYNQSTDNRYPCVALKDMCLMQFDGDLIAVGGAPIKGFAGREALDCVYVSYDNGVVWRPSRNVILPKELKGTSGPVAAVVDANKSLWIIVNKGIWRGRLNRLGFNK